MTHRFFEGKTHAECYAKFRPAYPSEIYDRIIEFMREQVRVKPTRVLGGCGH